MQTEDFCYTLLLIKEDIYLSLNSLDLHDHLFLNNVNPISALQQDLHRGKWHKGFLKLRGVPSVNHPLV